MSFTLKRQIYQRSPLVIKKLIALLPFSVLAGGAYRETKRRGLKVDRWSRREIRYYQATQLKKILEFACEQVPAYSKYKRFLKFDPFDALTEIPLLSKQELLENLPEYLPRDFDNIPHYESSTGGTSGNQLQFYLDNNSSSIEMAFMHRLWSRVGYAAWHRKATFRGVEFPNANKGIYWQFNPVYNEMQFSPFHMSDDNLANYVEQLESFKPGFLHGYPSAIDLLASYVLRHNIALSGIKAILLGSESVNSMQRQRIEKAFQSKILSWYGHTERVILAGECNHSVAYHHFPDYGFLEILSEDGRSVAFGEKGELVGTGFWNFSLPLIRYRTEDFARLLSPVCDCGRQFDRFDEVEGRWKQEFVIGKNGSRISPAALNMHGSFFDQVIRYQYFQDRPGILEIRLMVTSNFSKEDENLVCVAYKRKVGDELEIHTIIVDEIPLTDRGKLKRLIQNIPVVDN